MVKITLKLAKFAMTEDQASLDPVSLLVEAFSDAEEKRVNTIN